MHFNKALVPAGLTVMTGLGCATPDFNINRVQVGMSEDQILSSMGKPALAIRQGGVSFLEYETFDQDKWFGIGRKENVRRFFVRLVDGRVESFGEKKNLEPAKMPARGTDPVPKPVALVKPAADPKASDKGKPVAEVKAAADPKPAAVAMRPAAAAPFELRNELEKLETLKRDGLINEAEFKDLRQRVLDKAKAQ